ncbi:MAG: acyloxyacyl hydrolase [Thiopseudomonas sp.]|nr:acyloxyacyl hydrolase [Thiopseudomonas sp.]
MNNKRLLPALGLMLSLTSLPTFSAELALSAGSTGQGDATLRAGLLSTWNKQWWVSDTGHLGGYWDAGYTYWDGGSRSSAAHSVSFMPVFTYNFTSARWQPFIEGGIGVAAFSKTRVSSRKLGVAFSFEDRLGLGVTLPNAGKLGIRAQHYSNARIKKPNDGIESYSVFYHHPL